MIIGFGKTETDFEDKLEQVLSEMVSDMYYPSHYFEDDFVSEVRKSADEMAKQSQNKSDEYKESETYPDRYTQYWISTVADASHIIFVVSFMHINRRHGFSPDGWACLQTKKAFVIEHMDMDKKAKAA